jgi:para-aminobenzoate synthetase/4-amino-4-deoxychorismate lyase
MLPSALIDFVGAGPAGAPLRHAFGEPLHTLVAHTLQDVPRVLQEAEAQAKAGRWCVGFVRYEAAPAFDRALQVHEALGPLAWFAVYDQAFDWPTLPSQGYAPMRWRSGLQREVFDQRIARIHQAISDGEVYQINLTDELESAFEGDPLALFAALHRAQPAAYAAYLKAADETVMSVSPELFFDWREGRILSRPMKGTAPRGATPDEDEAQRDRLLASEKERAENLMIVDLIRNDLSRIAQPHSVQVPALFERRAWPTVWQMTSDVVASTRPGTGLADVFSALFPCGSVTGAPKVQAMRWIDRLETRPRGVYCGAVGVIQPGGAATFNVAIRTVILREGRAHCGIGSGITIDAGADDEWREWQHKRLFLERAAEPFELLQTMRLEAGTYPMRSAHVLRLQQAASHFGFAFDEGAVQAALEGLAQQHAQGVWRVRVLADANGGVKTEAFALAPTPGPVRVALAARAIEAPLDFLRHKTTRRGHYEAFTPTDPALFDTLLWNARGEITEFTRGNVIAELDDGRCVTPPLASALLDGVGRSFALARGDAVEAVLRVDELPRVRRLWFLNALRGPIEAVLAG